MNFLGKIAMAPVWVMLAIMALPILAVMAICKGLDRVSPNGSAPSRESGESAFRFAMRFAAWLLLAGLAVAFILSAGARFE